MIFKLLSAKLTGNPDTTGWSQAYEYQSDDSEKLKARGHLFAVIATNANVEGLDSVIAGREILSRIHEEYFGELKDPVLKRLKSSANKVMQEFSSWEDVEIGLAVIQDDTLYVVVGGGAASFILRDGELILLVASIKEGVFSVSGYPKVDDVIILGTGSFFKCFNSGIIKGALGGKNPSEAMESLAPTLHSTPDSGNVGAMVFKFQKSSDDSVKDEEEWKATAPDKNGFGGNRTSGIKLLTLLPDLLSKLKPPDVYIKSEPAKILPGSKMSASVGLALIVILSLSIYFGIQKKSDIDIKARYIEKLSIAKHQVEEAEQIYPLNSSRARSLLTEARGSVLALKSENIQDPEIDLLQKRVEENEKIILGEYATEVGPFIDLSLLSEGFVGDLMTSSQDEIYILDSKGVKLVSINIETERSEIVAGPAKIGGTYNLSAYADNVYVAKNDGIFEINSGKKEIDDNWEGKVFISSYAGNIYVIDKDSSRILRYSRLDTGFSSEYEWLAQDVIPNLTTTTKVVIDGSIWILVEGGILKFTHGNPQPFELSNIFPEVTKPKSIYTSEELDDLYILEQDKKRVVVVTKIGEYKEQYLSEKLRNATDLVVSEKDKKIILLIEGKLFAINMNR
ncbi:MAG: hypothetical protein UT08_C0005G0066 [Candidatus Woesebacteria bacterium GW2011_GWB1_38_8]|uniref:PPM-type phosphatase domain-containing protein n=1 Tax=Candidatus Woesebacteria bacterium GW2011_GWB1_38_8 TaxID=1618570 RepID=A0A0G0LCL6_9BACT|nr:MAG: hypothetical protein UT08_C0005G0066 [Candidatus Woesebacteria bacterium GW2011_GWB1_38_8]